MNGLWLSRDPISSEPPYTYVDQMPTNRVPERPLPKGSIQMSIYNTVEAELRCPCCGSTAIMKVNLYFGDRQLFELKMGDDVPWVPRKAVQNGGRPTDGNMEGEAYTECPICDREFFVVAHVGEGRLMGVEPDRIRNTPDCGYEFV